MTAIAIIAFVPGVEPALKECPVRFGIQGWGSVELEVGSLAVSIFPDARGDFAWRTLAQVLGHPAVSTVSFQQRPDIETVKGRFTGRSQTADIMVERRINVGGYEQVAPPYISGDRRS